MYVDYYEYMWCAYISANNLIDILPEMLAMRVCVCVCVI